MTLFGLFSKKNENNTIPFLLTKDTPDSSVEDVKNEVHQIEETDSVKNKPLTVSYATGWPIDIIYGFLNKDYESKGYEDAILNSNLTFRDMNIKIIRHKILMVFREINLKYEAMKQDFETRIETCNSAGLLTTATDLNKQLAVIYAHIKELSRLENDFQNNAKEASVSIMSYECGFLRGVSTIAMAGSTKNQVHSTPVAPTINAQNTAI